MLRVTISEVYHSIQPTTLRVTILEVEAWRVPEKSGGYERVRAGTGTRNPPEVEDTRGYCLKFFEININYFITKILTIILVFLSGQIFLFY